MPRSDRLDINLIKTVVSAVVRECFPGELDIFPAIWKRWTEFSERTESSDAARFLGLPMLGADRGEFSTPFVIMTVAAVMELLPNRGKQPNLQQVQAAVAEAARSFGVSGQRVDTLVSAIAPRLFHTFSALSGAPVQPKPRPPTQTQQVWVEWWLNGCRCGPEMMKYDVALADHRAAEADIVVNEREGSLRGGCGTYSFRSINTRAFIAIWLALDRTGSFFSLTDVRDRRQYPKQKVEPRAIGKHVDLARAALEKATGRKVIPRAKSEKYFILADTWSWCWIRESEDREDSILLYDTASPRE